MNRLCAYILLFMMFTVFTYNMKGFHTNVDFIRSEIREHKPDVVMLQETWHLSNSYQHLSSVHKDYMYVEQSGVDSQTEILIRGGLIGGAGRRHA